MHTKYQSLMAVLAAGLLAVGSSSTAITASSSDATTRTESSATVKSSEEEVRFFCREGYDRTQGKYVPTTFAWTKRGKMAVVRWVRDDFEEAGYDAWRRCREVSPRFQKAYENDSFKFITNGTMNGSPVICTAREKGGDCDTLLFTLLREDNALKILSDLKDILGGGMTGPLSQTGKPQVYLQVDIDEFLRTAPVE